jgi:hypothetical protein
VPDKIVTFDFKMLLPDEGSYLEYDKNTDRFYGLYGWTNDKKIMSDFKNWRCECKYYRYTREEVSSDDYKMYKENFKLWRIKYRKLMVNQDSEKYEIVPLTFYEKSIINDDATIYSFILDSGKYFVVDYYPLNDEITEALDILNYTSEYDEYLGGDPSAFSDSERDERAELASYNRGFNLTIFNNKYFDLFSNKLGIFMIIYKELLYGG